MTSFSKLVVVYILTVTVAALLLTFYYQLNYWSLLELKERGATHLGLMISLDEGPSVDLTLRALSFAVLPASLGGYFKFLSLLLGALLIVGFEQRISKMRMKFGPNAGVFGAAH